MKATLRKVYNCDHCKRTMLGAGAMSQHERSCKQNPINWHQCFKYCIHLNKSIESKPTGDEDYPFRKITHFRCTLLHKEMYSYKLEKYDSRYLKGLERMPLECDKYMMMEEQEYSNAIFRQ